MKLNVSKLLAGGLLALALPLLSACYATVGTDGRTYLTPMGYTYYSPTVLGMAYATIPATRDYTSFPIVSRKIVGTSDTCIVRPKPRRSCD